MLLRACPGLPVLTAWALRSTVSSVAVISGEDEDAVRGNRDAGRLAHAVHRRAISIDATGVALGPRVREVVVNVAVEHLVPVTGAREADCVAMVVEGLFAQAHDDDHITAYAGQPPAWVPQLIGFLVHVPG
jgi:hypothetical protein